MVRPHLLSVQIARFVAVDVLKYVLDLRKVSLLSHRLECLIFLFILLAFVDELLNLVAGETYCSEELESKRVVSSILKLRV